MKKKRKSNKLHISIVLTIMAMLLGGCSTSGNIQTSSGIQMTETDTDKIVKDRNTESESQETLIIYYSYSGTTRRVAEHLQALTGGTLYELELADPYTGSSNDVSDRVFEERDAEKMPELIGTLPNVSDYDRILIGTPVWNDSMANPILEYLLQTDFEGKTVAPFWTYITSDGTTGKDFVAQAQNAKIAEGLPLRSANSISDESLDDMLSEWLGGMISLE